MPRVLEQCYISHYSPELNGSNKEIVFFNFSQSPINPLDDIQKDLNKEGLAKTSSKSIYKAMDKDKNIVASSNSMD
jgi:hypothetical protein